MQEYERGRNVRAIALFEKSINMRPASAQNVTAHYFIGLAAWKLGRIPRAQEAFEVCRQLDPEAVEPIYALGVLHFEGGNLSLARELFEDCARRMRDDPRPLEFLGRVHLREGRFAEARRVLLEALSRASGSQRILTELALVEHAAGNHGKAVFYLQQALERDGHYPPALYNLARLQRDVLKSPAAARRSLEQYMAVETNHARRIEAEALLASLMPVAPAAPAAPAVAPAPQKEISGRPPASSMTAVVTAPVATFPPAPTVRSPTLADRLAEAKTKAEQGKVAEAVAAYLQIGKEAETSGDLVRQEEALRQALALGFDRAEVHVAWAHYLAARGDLTNALRSVRQAVVLQRDHVEANATIADLAAQLGEYDAALIALRQVARMAPERTNAWWNIAVLYDEKIGVPERAAEAYREFIRRFPGDPRVVLAQSRLKALSPARRAAESSASEQPSREETLSATPPPAMHRVVVSRPSGEVRLNIRRPIARNPQAAIQAFNRGTLYQQRQEWDQAIYYYTRALENDDTFVSAYFNLGAVYWARGDHELAKDAYRRAIELQPETPAARYNLALLYHELREWDAAVRELNALLEKSPDYAPAHYLLGILYSQNLQQADTARKHYEKFLELAPNDPSAPAIQAWLKKSP